MGPWGTSLTGNSRPGNVDIEGQPAPLKASDRIAVPLRSMTPGYFQLLGMPVAAGRDFRSTDNRTTPSVAVINQALAERYFPEAQPFQLWVEQLAAYEHRDRGPL
jgi:hypothetical protein